MVLRAGSHQNIRKTDYNEFKLTDPERLVFDFDNAKFSLRNRNRLGENGILDIETESEAIKKSEYHNLRHRQGRSPMIVCDQGRNRIGEFD